MIDFLSKNIFDLCLMLSSVTASVEAELCRLPASVLPCVSMPGPGSDFNTPELNALPLLPEYLFWHFPFKIDAHSSKLGGPCIP